MSAGGRAFVGVSGWRYARWRGDFYPSGLVQRRELEYIASHMSSAEINGSFYSLQRPSSYERWRDDTPDDFVFAVKGGRFITHMLALKNTDQALANFFASGPLALRTKLGPVLWQLPERLVFDPATLDAFLGSLPTTTLEAAALARHHDERLEEGRAYTEADGDRPVRHALEVRNRSFVDPAAFDIARRHGVAMVIADTAGTWPMVRENTDGFWYVRLHGSRELYASGYTDPELERWARDIRKWMRDGQDVYIYFDNDSRGHAPHDAVRLTELLA